MKKLRGLFVLPFLLVTLISPRTAHASVQDFTIHEFNADYTLSNKDKQGSLEVREEIKLTFNDYNHGILRAIPNSYKGHPLNMHVVRVASAHGKENQYTTYKENGNTVLKIGDPNKTITGDETYWIHYKLDNVIGFYKDHDELYWDINGDQWEQHFEHVKVTVHLPKDLLLSDDKPLCFTGAYGSSRSDCRVNSLTNAYQTGQYDKDLKLVTYTSDLVFETTQELFANQTLTVVAGFKKGYFAPPTWRDNLAEHIGTILKLILPPLFIGGYAIRRWRKFGRDPKGRGTIVPYYEPPFGLKPGEVGTLNQFLASTHDVTATIIDLAIRGYIKIIETKKDRLIGKDKIEYSFELMNPDFTKLEDFEQTIIKGVFNSTTTQQGSTVELKDLKNKFYTDARSATDKLTKRMINGGYFVSSPARSGGRLWALLILDFILLTSFAALLGWAFIVGLVIAGIIVLVCAIAMPARTQKGVEAKEQALGLKLYIETAEKDRIAMMNTPNAPYAANKHEPKRTVELFEKLLPYAMVFNVEKQWANQFQNIYTEPPNWYSGNWSSFNTGYLIGSLNNSMTAVSSTAFSSPSSSGSSGFSSGGGFSGGGGGGGGGGGW